ncbi:MAG: hypothetical protein ACYC9J_00420 [Sulfuricaulis sp.]
MAKANVTQNSHEIEIEGDRPVLIPPGEYELAFQWHRTLYLFGRAPKVACYFNIVTQGKYFEVQLARWYNVKTLTSKPRKGGAFKIGWYGDFLREYTALFGLPPRLERISTEVFKTAIVRGKVDTVTMDYKHRQRSEPLHYSVITELTGRVQ